jgi:hypothetical protein
MIVMEWYGMVLGRFAVSDTKGKACASTMKWQIKSVGSLFHCVHDVGVQDCEVL